MIEQGQEIVQCQADLGSLYSLARPFSIVGYPRLCRTEPHGISGPLQQVHLAENHWWGLWISEAHLRNPKMAGQLRACVYVGGIIWLWGCGIGLILILGLIVECCAEGPFPAVCSCMVCHIQSKHLNPSLNLSLNLLGLTFLV